MGGFRVCAYDLEMSGLNADFGMVLCGVVKDLSTGKVFVRRIDQYPLYKKEKWNDSVLCEALRDELASYDIMVGYNSVDFDVKYLNSRLLYYGLPTLPPRPILKHIDLLFRMKANLRIHSNSLDTVAKFFDLPVQKTQMDMHQWMRAVTGDRGALDYIVEHCEKDVEVLALVFEKVKHMVKEIR